jgi:hypothetical protein
MPPRFQTDGKLNKCRRLRTNCNPSCPVTPRIRTSPPPPRFLKKEKKKSKEYVAFFVVVGNGLTPRPPTYLVHYTGKTSVCQTEKNMAKEGKGH